MDFSEFIVSIKNTLHIFSFFIITYWWGWYNIISICKLSCTPNKTDKLVIIQWPYTLCSVTTVVEMEEAKQSWFTEVLFDGGPSLFFPKVSKIFHKTANSFSVYIFLSLTNHKSKMREVISWLLCFWFELLEKSQKFKFFKLRRFLISDLWDTEKYKQKRNLQFFERFWKLLGKRMKDHRRVRPL